MLFPFISMLGLIAVTITFAIPLAATGIYDTATTAAAESAEVQLTDSQTITLLVIGFLYYLVTYTIIIFSNTALIGAALMRLRGENPTIRDGFQIASSRLGSIIGYAAISATVGMILQMIRGNRDNIAGQIVGSILGMAWSLITFLVIPILVVENIGPIAAVRRSGSLLKRTWGENLVTNFGLGMLQFLAMLVVGIVVGLPMYALASAFNTGIVTFFAIAVVVIAVVSVALFFAALMGIFQAALYNYATEGEAGTFFEPSLIRSAFSTK